MILIILKISCIFTCRVTIPSVLHSLGRYIILSGIIFLLPMGLFNISCSANMLVMDSFSFCMSEKSFVSHLFWKDIFTEH